MIKDKKGSQIKEEDGRHYLHNIVQAIFNFSSFPNPLFGLVSSFIFIENFIFLYISLKL